VEFCFECWIASLSLSLSNSLELSLFLLELSSVELVIPLVCFLDCLRGFVCALISLSGLSLFLVLPLQSSGAAQTNELRRQYTRVMPFSSDSATALQELNDACAVACVPSASLTVVNRAALTDRLSQERANVAKKVREARTQARLDADAKVIQASETIERCVCVCLCVCLLYCMVTVYVCCWSMCLSSADTSRARLLLNFLLSLSLSLSLAAFSDYCVPACCRDRKMIASLLTQIIEQEHQNMTLAVQALLTVQAEQKSVEELRTLIAQTKQRVAKALLSERARYRALFMSSFFQGDESSPAAAAPESSTASASSSSFSSASASSSSSVLHAQVAVAPVADVSDDDAPTTVNADECRGVNAS
jgi:hypothetical protein